jgi:hypothetical protein
MKITSVKEVFNDHIEDMSFVVDSALGKTMAKSIKDALSLRKILKIKKNYDHWTERRANK